MSPRPLIAGPDGKAQVGARFRVERTGEWREVVAAASAGECLEARVMAAAMAATGGPITRSTSGQVAALAPASAGDRLRAASERRKLARLAQRGGELWG